MIRGEIREGREIANHPRENLKKAAIRGRKNASQIKEVFDDDAVTLWCCFRNGTAGTSERCKAETRAGSCSSLEHTDAQCSRTSSFWNIAYILTPHAAGFSHPLQPRLLDARLVRRGVRWPAVAR